MTGKSSAESCSIGSLVDPARQQPSQYGGDPIGRPKSRAKQASCKLSAARRRRRCRPSATGSVTQSSSGADRMTAQCRCTRGMRSALHTTQVQRTCDARRVIVSDGGPSPPIDARRVIVSDGGPSPPIDARRTVSPNAFTSLSCEYMNGASAEPVAVAAGRRAVGARVVPCARQATCRRQ